MKLQNFCIHKHIPDSSKKSHEKLNVGQLQPIELSWLHNGHIISIKNSTGVYGVPLKNFDGAAIIQAPYDFKDNLGEIYNADGTVRVALKRQLNFESIIYWDVMYECGHLTFIASVGGHDKRIIVDETTGEFISLSESR
jgi:hypothetical protein